VNHVFVETNFFIDVLRPFPAPVATALLARVGRDVTLYLPWVAIGEAKRTLVRIIDVFEECADEPRRGDQ
jgi:hypothetical protein